MHHYTFTHVVSSNMSMDTLWDLHPRRLSEAGLRRHSGNQIDHYHTLWEIFMHLTSYNYYNYNYDALGWDACLTNLIQRIE